MKPSYFLTATGILLLTSLGFKSIAQESFKVVINENVASYQKTSYKAWSSVTLKPGFEFKPGSVYVDHLGYISTFSITIPGNEEPVIDPTLVISNTVRFDKVTVAGIKNISELTQDNVQTKLSYFDGLGRPVQRVEVRASPNKKNIVQPIVYDQYGQQPIAYLAFASASGSATYHADALEAQKAFYEARGDAIVNDNYPFAITRYDNSPLDRVIEAGAPGIDWQPGNHTKRLAFRINTTAEAIKIWSTTGLTGANYTEGQLYADDITDENGNKVITYTNKLGQVILKRVQADAAAYLETVYIYNETGSLAYQVSPEGVKRIKNGTAVWDTSFIHSWASSYTYDAKNRLVAKKAPGAEPHFMVYDRFDRIVLTQDGRMRAANKWYFTKYDEINRVLLSGLYTDTKSREMLQQERDGDTANALYEIRTSETAFGYSNDVFPVANTEVLLANYYDDYDFDRNGAEDYQYVDAALAGAPVSNYKNNRGFLTGIKKKVTGGNDWLTDVLFYDEYGNVIQKRSNNLLNPAAVEDVTANVYDVFAGHISHTKQVKKTGASSAISVTNKLDYDHTNRLTRITVQHNNNAEQVIAQYEYNELGQLKDRKLHRKADGSFLQSLDYRYHVRGWLTHINNSKLAVDSETNDDNNDIFGFEILYNQKESGLENTRYYNGKISAVKWQSKVVSPVTGNPQRERSYRFSYDGADRLLKASYIARSSTGWDAEQNGYNEEVSGYDHNGNILSLKRNTWEIAATAPTVIDHLVYGYKSGSGNQLAKVNDSSGDSRGFNNLSDIAEEYSYDGNGNLTGDANKQISISYNELNKTSRVDYSDGRYVSYDYDAMGIRVRKTVHHAGATTTYNYIEGFVYENGTLSHYPTAEGRVRIGTVAKFEYFIKDHLGNVRASFEEQNGQAAIIQENHYYPFGMTMRGVVEQLAAVISGSNKQLYNGGAELQDDFMAEHSYSTYYREYDPVLGRFNAIDPMVDQYISWTPYNYAFNDPVGMNDPLGDSPRSENKEQGCACVNMIDIMEYLWKFPNGGSWSSSSGYHEFSSGTEAFLTGAAYMDYHNAWGKNGAAESFDAAWSSFQNLGLGLAMFPDWTGEDGKSNKGGTYATTGSVTVTGYRKSTNAANKGGVAQAGFTDELGQVMNLGGVVWGAAELGLQAVRQNNGPQAIGRFLGVGTQQTAKALRGTLGHVSNLGKKLGTAGMLLSTYSYGSQLIGNSGSISIATHANFWIGAGLYGAAAIVGGPVIGGAALIYGAGQLGSWMYNGKTLEENIIGK